jgi:uncharacterized LabA/DUF88 family protein
MRILLMIDGGNFFFAQKNHLGWMTDPAKLKQYVAQWGQIVNAYYYLQTMPNEQVESRERYRKALFHMGYSVIPIDVKVIQTPEGPKEKADADVRIALDAFTMRDTYDLFVLVSGDSDFEYLLKMLIAQGKAIKVISTTGLVASEILELAGPNFYDMADMRASIEKRNGHDKRRGD